ncbi:MAG: M48 family metallopeptidase [Acidimicrobiia bacterium]|nr:M48 family metallopeptidase [Acidimicrobiia bacterium]
MQVEVVRSTRRRKTVQARLVDGVLRVAIPAHLTAAEEARWVEEMKRRLRRDSLASEVDLDVRANRLANRYGLPRPASIEWSNRQHTLWGSTTIATSTVRLSSRLAAYPTWVLDYVIVHELAHLVEPNHTPAFWQLVEQYPRTERARGYLLARGEAGE